MTYQIIKVIHILSAIVALGANLTYGVWLRRASDNPEVLLFTLRTVRLIDNRLANPAYTLCSSPDCSWCGCPVCRSRQPGC